MIMPSREFLVRQASLNAIAAEMGSLSATPGTIAPYAMARFGLAFFGAHRPGIDRLIENIRVEFRHLVSQYEYSSDFGEDLMRIGAGGLK